MSLRNSKRGVTINIITCPEWKAKEPAQPITWTVKRASIIVFHHTDSHHREIANTANESEAEAIRYAQDIQRFHMGAPPKGRGWIDSGHNFLVTRGGQIVQGRWRTVSAIEKGLMVVSAHCPGQNDQIGIEHEHLPRERPTSAQLAASARLMAWIASQYDLRRVLRVHPHSEYISTACPDNLTTYMGRVEAMAQKILTTEGAL